MSLLDMHKEDPLIWIIGPYPQIQISCIPYLISHILKKIPNVSNVLNVDACIENGTVRCEQSLKVSRFYTGS